MKRRGFGSAGDYRGTHRAPGRRNGAPLFDLSVMYPCDVYTHPHYYADHHPGDRESWRVIVSARCKPEKLVTVYRAVPRGVTAIHPGDWVTLSRLYALDHAQGWVAHHEGAAGDVISMKVPAKQLFTEGNSLNEWGYDP